MKLLFTLLLILLTNASCVGPNAEGRRSYAFLPDSLVNTQSYAAYAEEKANATISSDRRRSQIVMRVGDRLIKEAKRSYPSYCHGFQWEVTLFDAPDTANAYCMPGGKIGIYTGILAVSENEAALATVMGHEIGHALLKHGNENMTASLGVNAGLYAVGLGLQKKEKMGTDVKDLIMKGAGIGAQYGVLLPFSRFKESEADRIGLRLMAASGYDPREAPNLWRRMGRLSEGNLPPVFASTHPSPAQRIQELEALTPEVLPQYEAAPVKYGLGDRF